MGSEMQEKIARAMTAARTAAMKKRFGLDCDPPGYDEYDDTGREDALAEALAAMEAMREPTDDMVVAGGNYVLDVGGIDGMHAHDRGPPYFIKGRETGSYELWQHMIDAEIKAANAPQSEAHPPLDHHRAPGEF
jgi:hypothetical protein